jgi:hypothetical protein
MTCNLSLCIDIAAAIAAATAARLILLGMTVATLTGAYHFLQWLREDRKK